MNVHQVAIMTLYQTHRHRDPRSPACLDWALRTGEPDGVWGGTTPAERRRLRAHRLQATA
ncbi:WhiB family transcriptional regulator [Nonomuraea sp. NBC_00507]|uniref:WhiB family transcriptional regulator n=1 Tax=Nonomuraea sp. NBC_00507 TaxID=2976002 RepID=UPI003FA5DAD2